jgi:uncharacterized protein (DUF2141 family)
MSSATNAHAEVATGTTPGYANNVICCSGLSGISCSGYTAKVLNLSSTTNAHVETADNSNYTNVACISAGGEIPVIAYQDTNCTGYDTTLASISSTTNATIGDTTSYTKKVCGSLVPPSITFSISTTTLYFGGLSTLVTVYASSTGSQGDNAQVEAHTFSVKTNTLNGYSVNVQGGTLTSGAYTIAAIGNINTTPTNGTSQFGLRINASGGLGVVSSPYSASGFAYAASATTSSQVAGASSGDNATTTYSVRYVANISGLVPMGTYNANLVYVATANF